MFARRFATSPSLALMRRWHAIPQLRLPIPFPDTDTTTDERGKSFYFYFSSHLIMICFQSVLGKHVKLFFFESAVSRSQADSLEKVARENKGAFPIPAGIRVIRALCCRSDVFLPKDGVRFGPVGPSNKSCPCC